MPRRNRDRLVGTLIDDRFEISRPLAEGGMARVYVATDTQDGGREIALKVLTDPGNHPQRNELVGRARREAEIMEQLQHPNIVATIAHGPFDGGYYLAMELIEGPTLTNFVRDNGTDPKTCLVLLLQLCGAVRQAHRRGVVHRDIKAGNVLVGDDGKGNPMVTLIDFGVVKVDGMTSLSGGNRLLGSVHTLAPEIVRGEEIDHRADIYSLGVLMFRLLAGRYPYHSRVAAEVISQHVHAPIPELDVKAGTPPGVPEIVRRCLAKSPDDRFQDVSELVEALADALGESTSTSTVPAPIGPPGTPTQPAPVLQGWQIAVLLLAVVAAAVVYFA